jgi:hypothetical protein
MRRAGAKRGVGIALLLRDVVHILKGAMITRPIVHELPHRRRQPSRAVARWLVGIALGAWLLASMLFGHGCHAEEDTELLLNGVQWICDR